MITQTLQLNLVPKGVWPRLYVSQYDAGSRTLTFEIYNGDQRFTLTSGTTAKIQGTKPDRHGFSYDANVDTSNNVITADITQQMTAAHGEAYCELVLFKSGQRIGTLNFVMMIQQAGLNDETDTSDSDLPDIIAEATEQMLTAEAYAKGTRDGIAVTSGQTGYHDNSKYYKEQAATQASNASTSATNANTNALKAEGYAVGKQNGTTQTSGTYYHNNAQYYKEQAASSATTASTKAGEASSSANTASQKASAASTSAQTASDKALVAEGYAKGTQNGTPVGSTSPYYHNNAEYFKNLANPTVAANVSFNNSGTEMSSTNVQDGIVENRTSIQNLSTVVSKNGAKNLLPFDLATLKAINTGGTWSGNSYTFHGITFTPVLDDDGNLLYINVDGTANANNTNFNLCSNKNLRGLPAGSYIMNGCPAGGAYNKYRIRAQLCDGKESTTVVSPNSEYGNGALMTFESGAYLPNNFYIYIEIWSGQSFSNAKFYPMIRLASDTDPTYEPYAKTNQQLTKETTGLIDNTKANGCVNYAPNNGTTKTASDGTTTFTWTVNADKTVTLSAPSYPVTLQANIASLHTWDLTTDECTPLVGKVVKLTGCPSGGDNKLRAMVYRVLSANGSSGSAEDYGDGIVFTWLNNGSGTRPYIALSALSGYVMTGPVTFKPMISLASMNLSYNDYVPYAKSNRELTEDVGSLLPYSTLLGNLTNGDVTSFLKVRDVAMNIYWTDNTGASDWTNMTNQQLTDVVQALLDTYKKLGGAKDIIYFGRLRIRGLTSNGTLISEGIYTPFALSARETYNTILSTQSGGGRNYGVITLIYFNVGSAAMCNLSMWSDDIRFSKLGLVDQSSPTTYGAQKLYSSKYTRITTYKG